MNESPLLDMQLRNLHLSTILANYRRLLGDHTEPLPYLCDLVSLEAWESASCRGCGGALVRQGVARASAARGILSQNADCNQTFDVAQCRVGRALGNLRPF